MTFLFIALALAGAMAGTRWVRRRALATALLDIPNDRSSHTVPTPRGGGLAIVLVTCATMAAMASLGAVPGGTALTFVLGGGVVAAVGAVDDRRGVPARWRLAVHFAAAFTVLYLLHPLYFMGAGPVIYPILSVYLVWMLNLTNFMDGIDGIASVQAVSVCLGGAFLNEWIAPGRDLWVAPLVLAAATAGFLIWNWPPAKIFMGDVGSGFLGLALGALTLQAGKVSESLLWSWLILMGVFVVDATYTLLRRLLEGRRIYEAHRTHAYQHAALRYGHRRTTLVVAAVNLLWLLPCAALVASGRIFGPLGGAMAYAPLLAAALWFGAGKPALLDLERGTG